MEDSLKNRVNKFESMWKKLAIFDAFVWYQKQLETFVEKFSLEVYNNVNMIAYTEHFFNKVFQTFKFLSLFH